MFTNSLNYGFTHTNGAVTVDSYIDAQGGWLGTRSNHPLYFFTNNGFAQMTIGTNGNVCIGLTNLSNARLDVDPGINNSFAIYARGGVGQSAGSFGLPKAMLLVRNNGVGTPATIEKCYNAVSGTSSGNCGFVISQPGGAGLIHIRFPFRVTDRFFSITPIYNSTLPSYSQVTGFDSSDLSGGTVIVVVEAYQGAEADFYLVVY